MAGVRKRESDEQHNIREVKKRKQLDQERTAAIEEQKHKGKQRAIVKNRNETNDGEQIDEKEDEKCKERATVKKRKQLDEENRNKIDEENRNEIDEANEEKIEEKEEQKGEERAIVKKRSQLEEERASVESRNETDEAIDEQIGKDVPSVKKRNQLDEETATAENRNEIGEKENHKMLLEWKRNQLDEETAMLLEIKNETGEKEDQKLPLEWKRTQLDEEAAIGIAVGGEKEEHKGKEILFERKRYQLEEEVDNKNEIEQSRIFGDEICKSLPNELWTENILTRLPARTLAGSSSVSKLWYNSYSKDARFAVVHNLQNKSKTSLMLNLLNVSRDGILNGHFFSLEDKGSHLDPKSFTRQRTLDICELVGYANGLACIKEVSMPGDAVGSVAVVNPIRSQILTLHYVTPPGGYMYLGHGFGFDSLSQVYKAVIIYTSKDNGDFVTMVFTLGTSSWRNITTTTAEISPPPGCSPFPSWMATRVSRSFCKQATFCGGDLLWRTTSEVDNDYMIEMLLSFDLHSEKIQFIRLPAESTLTTIVNEHQYLAVEHLLEFEGYPCIARSEKVVISNSDHCGHRCDHQSSLNCCCCCYKVHMYVLKDKVKQEWIREKTFDVQIKDQEGLLPAPLCCYFETSAVPPPTRILTLSDQVLLYWFNGESLILYNLLEKQLKVVKCSSFYPGIFRTKMNETLSRRIGDDNNIDCPYMDYQLYAQVENLVCMKTFIPKGAKTIKYECFGDLQHAIKGNLPAGCVDMGRESPICYAFWEDKVDDQVSDIVEGHPNGSCMSKRSRSKKNSGKAKRTLTAKKTKKVQSMGSELSGLLSACQATVELCKSYSVSNSISVENWMAVLEGVPDLDEDLRLDAVNLLGRNPLSAQIFVLMSPNIRKKWLIAKLRGN